MAGVRLRSKASSKGYLTPVRARQRQVVGMEGTCKIAEREVNTDRNS